MCVSLSNQKCMTQPALTNLHTYEYSQEFAVNLDRCFGSYNTINDLCNEVCICIPNKTEDLNLSVFNIITGINKSKTLTKHVSCECKFDGRKCSSDQWWNNNNSRCECRKHHVSEKKNVWNPDKCSFKNRKYLVSIMDDSSIMWDEVIC